LPVPPAQEFGHVVDRFGLRELYRRGVAWLGWCIRGRRRRRVVCDRALRRAQKNIGHIRGKLLARRLARRSRREAQLMQARPRHRRDASHLVIGGRTGDGD
jgi:hypothetical protein